MSEGLSRREQDLVELCDKRLALTNLSRRVGFLADEVRRSKRDGVLPIRASLTTDIIAEVAQAQAFLADLSQQLTALQREQVEEQVREL